jgi:hypothetical protein
LKATQGSQPQDIEDEDEAFYQHHDYQRSLQLREAWRKIE